MQALANVYLCILVRCKECQRTERSRSIQGVQKVPSPLEYPSDPEGREARRSQRDPGDLFVSLLVALRMGERGEGERAENTEPVILEFLYGSNKTLDQSCLEL